MRAFERLVLHVELLCGRLAVLNIKKISGQRGKNLAVRFAFVMQRQGQNQRHEFIEYSTTHVFIALLTKPAFGGIIMS